MSRRQIVCYSSDYTVDSLVKSVTKAHLSSMLQDVEVIDHYIDNQTLRDLDASAYALIYALNTMPAKCIHVFMSAYYQKDPTIILTKINDQYLILPNNGIVSLIHHLDYSQPIFSLTNPNSTISNWLISMLSTAIELIHRISNGAELNSLGTVSHDYKIAIPLNNGLTIMDDSIIMRILYVTDSKNIVLNLSKEEFDAAVGEHQFELIIRNSSDAITRISQHLEDVNSHSFGAYFNPSGYLEIFMLSNELYTFMDMNKKNQKFRLNIIK